MQNKTYIKKRETRLIKANKQASGLFAKQIETLNKDIINKTHL